MRTKEQISADYSTAVAELGLLFLQQTELPGRIEALRQRIYGLRQEHLEASARPTLVEEIK